jgi:hypothetical protein
VGVLSWKERSVVKLRTEVASVNVRNDATSRHQRFFTLINSTIIWII